MLRFKRLWNICWLIWGDKEVYLLMTCYTGQVFLLGRSEDQPVVCGRAHPRVHGRHSRWRARPGLPPHLFPSRQWGNLSRCQSGRTTRICQNRTGNWLNWIIFSLLNWTGLRFSLNWLKVSCFCLIIVFMILNMIWTDCGPLWMDFETEETEI